MDPVQPREVRVLVIEDNPHVSMLLRDGLEGSSRRELGGRVRFEFEVVPNGREALDRLDVLAPDLILLDVYMPVMDGAMFLRYLRTRPTRNRTPVIALSAGGPSAREAAISAGADAFLDKPLRLTEVFETAARLLGL